jgi:hydrogenase maturation protease
MKENILIIGKGNTLLKDEGIGIHVIRKIEEEKKLSSSDHLQSFLSWTNIEIMESGTSFLDILGELTGRTKVIIIDAVQARDDEPGTIYRFTIEDLKVFHGGNHLSLHHTSLPDLFALASFLDTMLPEMVIIGVNIKKVSPGQELSRELACKIPEIIAAIQKECIYQAEN